jgi:ABC-type sugar transport system substrate-binding protein
VTIVDTQETTQAEGSAAAVNKIETIMAQYPDVKVVLTYGTDQGQGANEYITGHVDDLSGYAVFTIDTAEFIRNEIKKSAEGTSAVRGTIMLGEGTPMTCYNLMDGSWADRMDGNVYNERCIMITPDTIGEYFPE